MSSYALRFLRPLPPETVKPKEPEMEVTSMNNLTWAERFALHDFIRALMRWQRACEMATQQIIDAASAPHCLGFGVTDDATACGGGAIGWAMIGEFGGCARCQLEGMADLGLIETNYLIQFDVMAGPDDWLQIERFASDKRDGR